VAQDSSAFETINETEAECFYEDPQQGVNHSSFEHGQSPTTIPQIETTEEVLPGGKEIKDFQRNNEKKGKIDQAVH
ncbi:hypothetical protein KI387_014417, partial [Taxus chinensis]